MREQVQFSPGCWERYILRHVGTRLYWALAQESFHVSIVLTQHMALPSICICKATSIWKCSMLLLHVVHPFLFIHILLNSLFFHDSCNFFFSSPSLLFARILYNSWVAAWCKSVNIRPEWTSSTHQRMMQVGWCGDRKHSFVVFLLHS